MSTLKSYKLGELYNVASGLSKARDEFGFGNPFVTFKDVFNNFFLPDKLTSLVNTNDKEVKSCSVKKGDIFLTRTSETFDELGMSCVSLKDYERATFNGFTKRLRQKENSKVEIDPVFIGYYFRSTAIRNQISMFASMTTRASLNSQAINSIEISIPEIEIQNRIGVILKGFDDKIELNRQMNHTLEQMAQALFKKYFVDFDFPDENGAHYFSAGGDMIDHAIGLIPKVCVVKSVYDLAEFINGAAYKNMYFSTAKDALPVVKIVELKNGITSSTKFTNTNLGEKYRIENGDILFSWSGSPDTSIDTFLWVNGSAWLNQHIFKIKTESVEKRAYMYCLLKYLNPSFIEIARNKQTTGLGHVTIADLKNQLIAFPPDLALSSFSSLVTPILCSIQNNLEQINNLSLIRDTLLPKLMSGEISVEQEAATI